MSSEAIGWVYRHCPYTGVPFAVHHAIADSCNDQNDDEFWMRQGKLSAKARTSRRSVNQALAQMVADGLLVLLESKGGANRYRLIMPVDAPLVFDRRTATGHPEEAPIPGVDHGADVTPPVTPGHIDPVTPGNTEPKSLKPKGTQASSEIVASLPWKPPSVVINGGYLDVAVELCRALAESVATREDFRANYRSKAWVTPMEALLRIDERPAEQVATVIAWLHRGGDPTSAWWQGVVLSPSSLRKHWLAMQAQYRRDKKGKPTRQATALGAGSGPDLGDVLNGRRRSAIEGKVASGNA